MVNGTTEVFCGVARLPREMADGETSSCLAIEMEVDIEKQVIANLAFTACPKLFESMLLTALLGKDPADGIAAAKSMMEERYHGVGKAAGIAALKNCLQEYQKRREPDRK